MLQRSAIGARASAFARARARRDGRSRAQAANFLPHRAHCARSDDDASRASDDDESFCDTLCALSRIALACARSHGRKGRIQKKTCRFAMPMHKSA
nr:hypothetical protein [Lysobacter enzymogenes]